MANIKRQARSGKFILKSATVSTGAKFRIKNKSSSGSAKIEDHGLQVSNASRRELEAAAERFSEALERLAKR